MAGSLLALMTVGVSCTADLVANNTEELAGNIAVSFINNTSSRASFSFGTWNSLDRIAPGPISLQQLRLEARETSAVATLPCRRNFAIGSQELIQRVIDTDGTTIAGFDAEAFVSVVNFSSAAVDSDAAALPTEGTAEPSSVLLGVDFKCGDQLFFTFEEDPDAPGGFRIDFSLISSEEDDA
jgi:hypothetical protein